MRYEVIREIFNKCSGNQMRDVFFDEVEACCLEEAARKVLGDGGYTLSYEGEGTAVALISQPGVNERYTFTQA